MSATPSKKYLPDDFEADINGPTFVQYAEKHFRMPMKLKDRKKKLTVKTLDEAVRYSKLHTTKPITKSVEKNLEDTAIWIQKGLLKELKIRGSDVFNDSPCKIFNIILQNSCLVDEVYSFFVRITTEPEYDSDYKYVFKYFISLINFITPTEEMQPYLRAHVARLVEKFSSHEVYSDYSHYLYIRLIDKINSQAKSVELTEDSLLRSFSDAENHERRFNCSLLEIMWHQRIKYPGLDVPVPLIEMTNCLINQGLATLNGVFRLAGSDKLVRECVKKANEGKDYLSELNYKEVADIMKKWLGFMDGYLIPKSFMDSHFSTPISAEDCSKTAESLPHFNRCCFGYIIRFLQELTKYSAMTMMDDENLAKMFAMIVADMPSSDNDIIIGMQSKLTSFILILIRQWKVDVEFPINLEMYEARS